MGNCNCGPQTKAEDDADNEVILMPGDDVLRSSLTAGECAALSRIELLKRTDLVGDLDDDDEGEAPVN